jgi:uroporphyrinogen-III synthase
MTGTTLVLTRANAQAEDMRQLLGGAGVRLIDLPLQRIGPAPDPLRLRAALAALPQTDLALPVSPTAVAAVFAALPGPWPAHCAIGVVGAGSLRAVRRALQAQPPDVPWPRLIAPDAHDDQSGESDSEALWHALQLAFPGGGVAAFPWAGRKVSIFRGGPGREFLVRKLEQAGAKVKIVDAYSRLAPEYDAQTAAQLRAALAGSSWWLLASTEAIGNLLHLLEAAGCSNAVLQPQGALAIHPRIAQAAGDAGFGRVELTAASPAAVLATLQRLAGAGG